MKKSQKYWLSFLCFCMLSVLFFISSSAAEIESFSAVGYTDEKTEENINWTYSQNENKYYLILPSTADLENLKISFVCDEPLYVDENLLVSGMATSVFPVEGDYILNSGENSYTLCVQKTTLPAVILHTESGSMEAIHANKENKEKGTAVIASQNKTEYNGKLSSIKGRGNATWFASKKPYNIKLDKKTDLFGMGKAKGWCLLANYYDKSLIRNQAVYQFAEDLGLTETSKMVQVDLFINGDYYGVYALVEKVEIGENRIDIFNLADATQEVNGETDIEACSRGGDTSTNPGAYKYIDIPQNPEDITGGYLLELDFKERYQAELCGFVTSRGQCVVVKEPEYASKEQVEYIRDWYQQFEDAVYSETGFNAQGKHYSEYCDMESLVKVFFINDYFVNIDGAVTSFFLYKDTNAVMQAGPIWDFDNSSANTYVTERNGFVLDSPTTEYISKGYNADNGGRKHLCSALFTHEEFRKALNDCVNEEAAPLVQNLLSNVDTFANQVKHDMFLNAVVTDTFGNSSKTAIEDFYDKDIIRISEFYRERFNHLSTYYASEQTESESPESTIEKIQTFIMKIVAFFRTIFNSFKNLFKR